MNLTLSIDETVIAKARELASRRGTSVNQLVRDYLAALTAQGEAAGIVAELDALWAAQSGDSGRRGWSRDELYDRPVLR